MKAEEILVYLKKDVFPVYDGMTSAEKKICHAVLQSLPYNEQEELRVRLIEEKEAPMNLISFFDWMLEEHQPEPYVSNESIGTLLKWYTDKKSKKVSYAYERLTRRYAEQSFTQQKQILRAFLKGGKKASEWASVRLRKHWMPGLESVLISSWRSFRGTGIACTVVRYANEDFVYEKQDALLEDTGDYSMLCARLGHRRDFTIDESRLTISGWFYVAGKLGLSDWIPTMDAKVDEYIRGLACKDYLYYQMDPELTHLRDIGLIIWGMKRLCYSEGLLRLAKFQSMAKKMIEVSDVKRYRFSSFVYFLKSFVSDEVYDDDAYKKEVQSWYLVEYGYVPIDA